MTTIATVPALNDLLAEAAALAITFFRDILKDPAAPLRERRMAATAILRHAARPQVASPQVARLSRAGSDQPSPNPVPAPLPHTPTLRFPTPPAPPTATPASPTNSPQRAEPPTSPIPDSLALARAIAILRSTAPHKLATTAGRADTG